MVDEELLADLVGEASTEAVDAFSSETDAATAMEEAEAATGDTETADDAASETDLLVDLAKAMHEAAAARRTRTLDAVEHRRAMYVQSIRERGTAETAALREQADRDVTGIQSWAEAEIERIHSESERRNEARKRELDALLDRHVAQLEWEIEAIEATVASHRTDLETFFGRLDSESDVTMMASLAQDVPQLPDLESISAAARSRAEVGRSAVAGSARATPSGGAMSSSASATSGLASEIEDENDFVDEDRLIGVMDPAARGRTADLAIEPVDAEPAPAMQMGEPSPLEPVAAERSSGGPLLQAIAALRPSTSWLRAGNGSEHDDTKVG